MYPNRATGQFEFNDEESALLPDTASAWPIERANELCMLLNERMAHMVGSTALSEFPEGSLRRMMMQKMERHKQVIEDMRQTAAPFMTPRILRSEDIENLLNGEK